MIRRIIQIDESKCNGCGACASACHEGAIQMIDGVAKLVRDDYCDGLGDCLPACPTGAITFVEREAAAYDEAAVMKAKAEKESGIAPLPCGCPGTAMRTFDRTGDGASNGGNQSGANGESQSGASGGSQNGASGAVANNSASAQPSRLQQWPVQIKLVPPNAPWLSGADLLIAADCTAFAYGNFHEDFIKGRITLVGCPKLDAVDYSDKLTAILAQNEIRSITITRMQVPCCGGIEFAVKKALERSGKNIPLEVVTISTSGNRI